MSRSDYKRATNSAYSVIRAYNINKIPVCLDHIINHLPDLRLMTYTSFAELNGVSIDEVIDDYDEYGSLVYNPFFGRYLILYNNLKSFDVVRFTIAHELGHYFLKHKGHNEANDKEANCFARNLLCPLPALDVVNQTDYFCLSSIFGISWSAAATRICFIHLDRYHLNEELYNSIDAILGRPFFIDYNFAVI